MHRFVYPFFAAILAMALLVLQGCGSDDKAMEPTKSSADEVTSSQGKSKPPMPRQTFDGLKVSMLINDTAVARLTADVPLYLVMVVDNPGAKPVKMPELNQAALEVTGDNGEQVPLAWRRISAKSDQIAAGGGLAGVWLAQGELKPGSYNISLEVPRLSQAARDAGLAKVSVEPAVLVVKPGKADQAVLARFKRRIMLLEGRYAEALQAVRKALTDNPSDDSLRLEMADTLALSGRPGAARKELVDLGVSKYDSGDAKANKVHLPSWYFFYLDRLGEAAAKGNTPIK